MRAHKNSWSQYLPYSKNLVPHKQLRHFNKVMQIDMAYNDADIKWVRHKIFMMCVEMRLSRTLMIAFKFCAMKKVQFVFVLHWKKTHKRVYSRNLPNAFLFQTRPKANEGYILMSNSSCVLFLMFMFIRATRYNKQSILRRIG